MQIPAIDLLMTDTLNRIRDLGESQKAQILGGGPGDYAEYRFLVGYLRGLEDSAQALLLQAEQHVKEVLGDDD